MIKATYVSKRDLDSEISEENGLGVHLIMEFYDCNPNLLEKAEVVEKALLKAAREAGLTIIGVKSHQFNPRGATSMVIVGESHLSIHSWPEYGFAALDIFVCGKNPAAKKAAKILIEEFKPGRVEILKMVRGKISNPKG